MFQMNSLFNEINEMQEFQEEKMLYKSIKKKAKIYS